MADACNRRHPRAGHAPRVRRSQRDMLHARVGRPRAAVPRDRGARPATSTARSGTSPVTSSPIVGNLPSPSLDATCCRPAWPTLAAGDGSATSRGVRCTRPRGTESTWRTRGFTAADCTRRVGLNKCSAAKALRL